MRHTVVIALGFALLPASLVGQDTASSQPYAGHERRTIKALSDDEIAGLRAGRGLSFALPAELNHYPGPRHALDLADSLRLTGSQRNELESVYRTMLARAIGLGAALIEIEARIDSVFAARRMDERTLRRLVRESARIRGELRLVHLRAHLPTVRVLTPAQIVAYDRLRGYGGAGDHTHH